ncbi:uncharacterized protein F5147DRAFT_807845 [Suillus discolor]|uniref:Uncharacterized protein n=1 Tax=Suillus discolor TaxID=1912936 RepID=A0A9P7F4F4_9AGAM|nr:uncharacterized protein F5147DRAFT_807845 [Suillus discolor]KAG2104349.1 hypothetical protein F5147DRAFT_807845 [Suillus discolor]
MNAGSRLQTSQVWEKEQRYSELPNPAQRTLLPLDVLEYSLVPACVFILFVSSAIFMLPELVMLSPFFHSAHGLRRGAFAIVMQWLCLDSSSLFLRFETSPGTVFNLDPLIINAARMRYIEICRFVYMANIAPSKLQASSFEALCFLRHINGSMADTIIDYMSEDNRPDAPPETCEPPIHENSSRPRCRIKQTIQKSAKGVTKKLSKPFKSFRNRTPANQNADLRDASTTMVQNVEMEGASSSQKIEHLTAAQILSDSVNQGLPGEPASQVQAGPSREEEGTDTQLVGAELQAACDSAQSMRVPGKHATSAASAAGNAPAGLAAAADFEKTYLQPLKIIDGVLDKIADLHPYAKMALGVLSAASKIIIAQAERDKSICSLLEKLAEVYRFMTLDENLGKIESMRGIVGKIVQQTHECARFIRDYSETKSFCASPSYRTSYMNLTLSS